MNRARLDRMNGLITEAIEEPQKRGALYHCMKRGRDSRTEKLLELPGGAAFRDEVKATKERCIEEQEALMARFIQKAEARGAKVFVAETGADAIRYTLALAKAKGARSVAKSKSLTTEEIEINQPIEEAGIRVVETDLGELIIQLVNEKPYHLVFPSVHKMAPDVAEIFSKETGEVVPNDIPTIMRVVRKYLRPIFLNADIGMTGANVGIAETGGIVIETNEGNARLVSSIPKVHVCVMGMEKIVDTIDDALLMVLAHPVSASGQCPTTYVTWMHGRNPLGGEGDEPDAERETHIIILDNGRRRMREDPLTREALHCIRCGACMNVCPTYGVVGGHAFGYIYPGPIGIPWTAEVHGLDKAANFADLCISCGLCKEICPAKIDMPMQIATVKHRVMQEEGQPRVNKALMNADRMAKLGSAVAPLANAALGNKAFRAAMESATGIDKRRTLPKFASPSFEKRWKKRAKAAPDPAKPKIAYFIDIFANFNRPDLGEVVVDLLQAAGCEVVVPEQKACGYPFIGYGDLDSAREYARFNAQRFAPYAREGYAIVASEPTAAYCLRESWPKLLPNDEDIAAIASVTHNFFDFVIANDLGMDSERLRGRRFGYHCSCHQRPLGMGMATMEWVRRQGGEIQFIETGTCCGMAGTFGLKHGPLGYDLANAVGEPLFEQFKAADIEAIITESSVCAIHLAEGTGKKLLHPLELLGDG